MDKEYLHILKTSADVQSKKPKIKESKEEVLLEEAKGDNLQEDLVKWFIENPYPEDKKVHAYAESKGIAPDKLETTIYKIISSVLSEGKTKGKDIKHDPKELEIGMKVEMEHTSCPLVARKISLDHLSEIPDYYTRLKKMEAEAGIKD